MRIEQNFWIAHSTIDFAIMAVALWIQDSVFLSQSIVSSRGIWNSIPCVVYFPKKFETKEKTTNVIHDPATAYKPGWTGWDPSTCEPQCMLRTAGSYLELITQTREIFRLIPSLGGNQLMSGTVRPGWDDTLLWNNHREAHGPTARITHNRRFSFTSPNKGEARKILLQRTCGSWYLEDSESPCVCLGRGDSAESPTGTFEKISGKEWNWPENCFDEFARAPPPLRPPPLEKRKKQLNQCSWCYYFAFQNQWCFLQN